MRQTIFMGIGALVGVIALLVIPSSSPVPQLGRVFTGAFIGVSLHGLVFGQLSWVARGGTPGGVQGRLARIMGGSIIVTSAVFAALA